MTTTKTILNGIMALAAVVLIFLTLLIFAISVHNVIVWLVVGFIVATFIGSAVAAIRKGN